jgi:hypothetical protein
MNDLLSFLKLTYIGPVLVNSRRLPLRLIGAAVLGYNALLVYQQYVINKNQQQNVKG